MQIITTYSVIWTAKSRLLFRRSSPRTLPPRIWLGRFRQFPDRCRNPEYEQADNLCPRRWGGVHLPISAPLQHSFCSCTFHVQD